MKLVIAATGASGTIYLQRLLEQIDCAAHEIHLVMSAHAKQVAKQEVGALKIPKAIAQHSESDLDVPFVSGSARFDAMVIVPCSMATLGRVASGSSDSALLRAADVFLKERRKLILVPRETPWNLIHGRNAVTLLEAGASAFLIKSACPTRARTAGAVTCQNLSANIEDRRSTRALADRVRVPLVAALGAHAALRNRRSRRHCWKTDR